MKKYNEKMITDNGKMVYGISIETEKGNTSDKTHIIIRNGEIYFTNNWYSSAEEFDFGEEAHQVAKEIFMTQLQADIKRRILELKQLEEVFNNIGLKECLGTTIKDETPKLINKIINAPKEVIHKVSKKSITKGNNND